MPAFLPNTTTTDKYTDTVVGGQSTPYDRGQLLIANNPASVIVFRGADRASVTQDEYPYVTPSLLPLVRGERELIFGVQVKSAISGSPAQVSGYLIEPGVAGLGPGSAFTQSVAAGGGVTPGVSSVQIQKNGVLISTEPIIDFIDGTGVTWSIADDAANTRVTVQAAPTLQLIQDQLLAVAGAFSFTAIPATFKHLRLEIVGRSTLAAGADTPVITLNGDGGANYNRELLIGDGAAASAIAQAAQNSVAAGIIPGATSPANYSGVSTIVFLDYAGTTFYKNVLLTFYSDYNDPNQRSGVYGAVWKNTAAINRVDVGTSLQWLAGSRATLYGF